MSFSEWKTVVRRSWNEGSEDNIGLIAAGVAFYGFLALVPLLAAIVLSYGLLADPHTVVENMKELTSVMPSDAAKLVGEQLMNVVKASDGKKGFGVLVALGIALFGARNGAGSVITALNIAYEEKEKRGFVALNALALAITATVVGVAIIALIAIAALGHLEKLLSATPGFFLLLGKLLSYGLLGLGGAAAAATLYRYAPSRAKARWVWISPGSLLAAVCWLLLTLGFGIYVARFGDYNATYGSLGAVVVMLTWIYLSSYILLFGAELNAELEHETIADTTEGREKPVGERGAWVADHVAPDTAVADTPGGVQPTPVLVKRADSAQAAPSTVAAFFVARISARAARLIGVRKVGMFASATTTLGLALIRKPGKAGAGAALIVFAVASAWLTREHDHPKL